jgi:L-lactate dehydrogenase complex protein LldF
VKIDIHTQLYKWRQIITKELPQPIVKRMAMKIMGIVFASPKKFARIGKIARWSLRNFPKALINAKPNIWSNHRDLPEGPPESFEEWYKKRNKDE